MKFESRYFNKVSFNKEQIEKNLNNAIKDLDIAKKDKILEVKFNYAYTAFLKTAITLLSHYQVKVKSAPGHHVRLIEATAAILKDESISDMGNIMRSKRNLDLYAGGIEVTKKECKEYINFVESVLKKAKAVIKG